MNSFLIRTATPADAEPITTIYLRSREAFLPYAPSAYSDEAIAKWIATVVIARGGATVVVRDGAVAAFCSTSIDVDGVCWIDQLYASPDAVGLGLGASLLRTALSTLSRPIRLYTFEANTAARRFYERHGFNAIAFGDGSGNEEKCPDVLYELR
ncbi:MAG: GNAT family N-acetyltransferase [Burkholderiales bacterium]|nr:MAG: GNAT family N-acetyltransferase [Burkholderiales bacterium]TAG83009.1 MAG: GNAT family N-acetyltransferase [Betaproteobacteria bacterium]